MEKLSLMLWRERELLESVAYRLEVKQMLLAGGRTKWLPTATRELEELLMLMRETEVLRAVAADEAALEVGLEPNPSLSLLAELSIEPWRSILLDHRDALVRITGEIAALSQTNNALITAGYRSARETLLAISGAVDEQQYSPAGEMVTAGARNSRIDRSL